MSDYLVSLIRTSVPTAVAAAIAWISGFLNAAVPDGVETGAVAFFGWLAVTVYYAVVRLLEQKWPIFGWLLGSKKPPTYL